MTGFEIQIIAKFAIVVFGVLVTMHVPALMAWVERRQGALIQRRVGPNRVGLFNFRLFGLGQSLADAIKLLFKEDFVPSQANKFFFLLAPVVTAAIGIAAFSSIPLGDYIIVAGEKVRLQAVTLNAGFLYLLALSSLGVYGVTLAGWAANSKYTLLGGMRASAQMVSYEIGMGLSLLPIVIIYGTLDLNEIVLAQGHTWGIFYAPVSFVIFVISMFAETNRLPFDLSEGEAELIAGYHTEHGSMRFALFMLGEYGMMFTLSAFVSCMFLGGYQIPWLPHAELVKIATGWVSGDQELGLIVAAAIGFGALFIKICAFMFLFVQVRWTLPRFRYDQLMRIGWLYILPIAFINAIVTALVTAFIKF